MKKALLFLMSVLLLLGGCSSSNNNESNENPNTKSNIENETVEDIVNKQIDHEVEIILTMYSFEEDETIEEYISSLKEENPDKEYIVYDDSHYIQKIKESERLKMLEDYLNKEEIKKTFDETFSDESYCGAYLNIEYDDLFKDITIYVDKELYDESIEENPFINLGTVLYCGMYSDIVQAFNLVPPEERSCHFQIIDTETSEVIFDSDELKDNENEESEEESVEDVLFDINNWLIMDIWNNYVDFDWYKQTGLDCTGSEIDIEFAYNEYLKSYGLKSEYDAYINSLGSDYEEVKSVWSKISEQIDMIHNDLETNGISEDGSGVKLDLLRQYMDSFDKIVNNY